MLLCLRSDKACAKSLQGHRKQGGPPDYADIEKRIEGEIIFFIGDTMQYFGSLQSRELGQAPIPATGVPFLLGRRYHLACLSVCASQKYFFHIGCKMNVY